ncbi:hypothetical protein GN244_ATG12383 [Phytophthora infestans]|uniref:Myosin-like protein n=1 Tax=Phytophthora infestans TaxID=4787 RepID=A0A833WSP2_PHYIN|nr:hypothetical protein GN244_ATG12383 [Phytophthora infestans]KAF4139332.1 hypothetical protein GN958_ATG11479 [Phytophthora infestans]
MTERALQSLQADRDELSEAESRAAVEKHSEEADAADETIRSRKDVETTVTASMESLKRDLAEAESCVMVLVEEQDAARKDLTAALQEDFQEKVAALETELKELHETDSAEQTAAHKTIASVKAAEAEEAETLTYLCQELAEAEGFVMALVDECCKEGGEQERSSAGGSALGACFRTAEYDTVTKALSELKIKHGAMRTQNDELGERIESLAAQKNHLVTQHSSELESAEETIRALKTSDAEVKECLTSVRQELAETEIRVEDFTGELSDKGVEIGKLTSEADGLHERIPALEGELQTLQSQRKAKCETAEETIASLKESEAETMEMLESIRAKWSETETHKISTEEKTETAKLTFKQNQYIAAELTKEKASLIANTSVYESTVTDLEINLQAEAHHLSDAVQQIETQLQLTIDALEKKLGTRLDELNDKEKEDDTLDESFDVRYESDEENEIIEDNRTKLVQRAKRVL